MRSEGHWDLDHEAKLISVVNQGRYIEDNMIYNIQYIVMLCRGILFFLAMGTINVRAETTLLSHICTTHYTYAAYVTVCCSAFYVHTAYVFLAYW